MPTRVSRLLERLVYRLAAYPRSRKRAIMLAADAVCSSADSTHEALLTVYRQRYGQQIELAGVDEILRNWPG